MPVRASYSWWIAVVIAVAVGSVPYVAVCAVAAWLAAEQLAGAEVLGGLLAVLAMAAWVLIAAAVFHRLRPMATPRNL